MRDSLTWQLGQGPAQQWDASREQWAAEGENQPCTLAQSFEETEFGNQITVDVSRSRVRLPISVIRLALRRLFPGSLGNRWVSEP